jgi:threonine synthase
MHVTHLECTECRLHAPADQLATLCTACAAPLAVRYDLARVASAVDRDALQARPATMWRFAEVLPLMDPVQAVTLGEGGTPLLRLAKLGAELGLDDLWLKDEGQNPTGSFKARGMSAAVSMAKALGATALAAPSAGNAGGALAAYGARAGLPVQLAMPRDVPAANRIEAEVCGAQVELVDGSIADCGRWIAERAVQQGWFCLSTLKEPYRVEGKKTMGYELAQDLGWELPDVILYPTGGGTGLVGMAKAFDELRQLGWIQRDASAPRFVAVQARGCAPVVNAFHSGAEHCTPIEEPRTVAAGLRVPGAVGDRWMLRVLRASEGSAVAVSDDELLEGTRQLARTEGLFAAPEAGALIPALEELLRTGFLKRDERIVLFGTGTGMKYCDLFSEAG